MRSIYSILGVMWMLSVSAQGINTDSLLKCARNEKLSLKDRIYDYVHVSNNIEEEKIETYALEGLALTQRADSINFGLEEFWACKGQLLFNLGVYKKYREEINEASKYYFDALSYFEKAKREELVGDVHNNIGILHITQGEHNDALREILIGLGYYKKTNQDSGLIGTVVANIAGVYDCLKARNSSVKYYHLAIRIFKNIKDEKNLASAYNNLATLYRSDQIDSAMIYLKMSLPIFLKIGNEVDIAWTYDIMGTVFWNNHQIDSSFMYCNKCIEIANRRRIADRMKSCYYNQFLNNKFLGNYKAALTSYLRSDSVRDSTLNLENRLTLMKGRMNYDFTKKEEKLRLDATISSIRHKEENLRTKVILGFVCVFLVAICIFAYFMFRNYKKEKISKEIIEGQKSIIEEKQKEILDSIRYARRIQTSLLASEKYIFRSIERLKNKL